MTLDPSSPLHGETLETVIAEMRKEAAALAHGYGPGPVSEALERWADLLADLQPPPVPDQGLRDAFMAGFHAQPVQGRGQPWCWGFEGNRLAGDKAEDAWRAWTSLPDPPVETD